MLAALFRVNRDHFIHTVRAAGDRFVLESRETTTPMSRFEPDTTITTASTQKSDKPGEKGLTGVIMTTKAGNEHLQLRNMRAKNIDASREFL